MLQNVGKEYAAFQYQHTDSIDEFGNIIRTLGDVGSMVKTIESALNPIVAINAGNTYNMVSEHMLKLDILTKGPTEMSKSIYAKEARKRKRAETKEKIAEATESAEAEEIIKRIKWAPPQKQKGQQDQKGGGLMRRPDPNTKSGFRWGGGNTTIPRPPFLAPKNAPYRFVSGPGGSSKTRKRLGVGRNARRWGRRTRHRAPLVATRAPSKGASPTPALQRRRATRKKKPKIRAGVGRRATRRRFV